MYLHTILLICNTFTLTATAATSLRPLNHDTKRDMRALYRHIHAVVLGIDADLYHVERIKCGHTHMLKQNAHDCCHSLIHIHMQLQHLSNSAHNSRIVCCGDQDPIIAHYIDAVAREGLQVACDERGVTCKHTCIRVGRSYAVMHVWARGTQRKRTAMHQHRGKHEKSSWCVCESRQQVMR